MPKQELNFEQIREKNYNKPFVFSQFEQQCPRCRMQTIFQKNSNFISFRANKREELKHTRGLFPARAAVPMCWMQSISQKKCQLHFKQLRKKITTHLRVRMIKEFPKFFSNPFLLYFYKSKRQLHFEQFK